jgi:hypothetical protein
MNPSRRVNGSVLGPAVAMLIVMAGCADPAAPPTHTNIDWARRVWLESHPSEYTFEIEFTSSWWAPSGYYSVHVADSFVIAATDSSGKPVEDFSVTVDTVWTRLLKGRARGELNSAYFNGEGVPVEVDSGPWPSDGGWHISVRNFMRLR